MWREAEEKNETEDMRLGNRCVRAFVRRQTLRHLVELDGIF